MRGGSTCGGRGDGKAGDSEGLGGGGEQGRKRGEGGRRGNEGDRDPHQRGGGAIGGGARTAVAPRWRNKKAVGASAGQGAGKSGEDGGGTRAIAVHISGEGTRAPRFFFLGPEGARGEGRDSRARGARGEIRGRDRRGRSNRGGPGAEKQESGVGASAGEQAGNQERMVVERGGARIAAGETRKRGGRERSRAGRKSGENGGGTRGRGARGEIRGRERRRSGRKSG